jgi:AAA+ superfamily predicted ATPase
MIRSRRPTPAPTPTTGDAVAAGALTDALLRRAVLTRRRRAPEGSVDELIALLPGYRDAGVTTQIDKDTADDLTAARALLVAATNGDGPLGIVCRAAALDDDHAELLAVLVAIDIDPHRRRLAGILSDRNGAVTRRLLTELFDGLHTAPLSADTTLAAAGLIVIDSGVGARSDHPIHVAPAVTQVVLGLDPTDPALPTYRVIDGAPDTGGDIADLVLAGGDRGTRRTVAQRLSHADRLLVVESPNGDSAWEAAVRMATIHGAGLLVELDDELPAGGRRWIERARHLSWVISTDHDLPLASLPAIEWSERRVDTEWPSVRRLADLLGTEAAKGRRITSDQLDLVERSLPGMQDPRNALRRLASGELDRLSVRITPRRTWGDLVLDPEQSDQLRDVVRRFRHRNLVFGDWALAPGDSVGITVLLAGPPGTGKTMASEVVAGELGLDLFKVNVAAMVSKYVGETEKNLEAIFDAAEAADVVLLFDEADAIFGKRGEVSDANDKYANLETSYLLQRIERFTGVAMLTTNLASNIDTAFLRRIDVSINFPLPEEAERRRIWEASLPRTAPVGDVDLDFLAKTFRLAGGAIKNIALTAAFLAAEADREITMRDLMVGTRRESAKMGRLVDVKQFGPYAHLLDGTA